MKKIFALGFGILMLASCSSDDNSLDSSKLTNKKWYNSEYVINGLALPYEHENIECGKDYTIFEESGVKVDGYYNFDCEEFISEDLWSLKGNKITITNDFSSETFTISKLTDSRLEVTGKQDVDEDGKLDNIKLIFTSN